MIDQWQAILRNKNFIIYTAYLDWSLHVWSFPSEVQQYCDRQTNGKPVNKADIVDEGVHVG